jgi:hypothetical protein
MTKAGTARLFERLKSLEALWRSAATAPEKAAAMVAMRTQARKIVEAGDEGFDLDDYLSGVEKKRSSSAGRTTGGLYFEIQVHKTARWAQRMVEILEEQRAGAVSVERRQQGRLVIFEIRGEAAEELYQHFLHYQGLLEETSAFDKDGDEGLNDAFEVVDIIRKDLVG